MILVIGYGSELRRDDAAGLRVAERVGGMGLPEVRAVVVHQLTPDLAEPLSLVTHALFVDAWAGGRPGQVEVVPCPPVDLAAPLGHVTRPQELLALTEAVFGRSPSAWLIRIPVADLELGEGMTPMATAGVEHAVEAVQTLIAQWNRPEPETHSHPHHHHHPEAAGEGHP